MQPAPTDETLAYVLKTAAITAAKLHRWQRLGLVPRKKVRRGRGYGRGTVALYPPGTAQQALAVSKALLTLRSAEAAAWNLWMGGHELTEGPVRRMLMDQVTRWDRELRSTSRQRTARVQQLTAPAPLKIGQPVDRDQLGHLLQQLMQAVIGAEVDDATGKRHKVQPDPAIAPTRVRQILARLSWDELRNVRDEFSRLFEALPYLVMPHDTKAALVLVVLLMVGALAFAHQGTKQSARAARRQWTLEARAFLVWLALRESPLSSHIAQAAKQEGHPLLPDEPSSGISNVEGPRG